MGIGTTIETGIGTMVETGIGLCLELGCVVNSKANWMIVQDRGMRSLLPVLPVVAIGTATLFRLRHDKAHPVLPLVRPCE